MTGESVEYPRPQEDSDNRDFLEAWRDGCLAVQVCGACGRSFFYPRPLCPHCWSDRLSWQTLPGKGEVVSFSAIYRPNHPSFFSDIPIVLAEIRVAEEISLLARIIDIVPEAVRIGTRVRLLAKSEANRYPLPTFRPDER